MEGPWPIILLPPGEGGPKGRMRVDGFTEKVRENRPSYQPEAPASASAMTQDNSLAGASGWYGIAQAASKSNNPHPALRATLPRGERE